MGLTTLMHPFSLDASSKASTPIINTSIALHSAAGARGGFDTPHEKCPPDGGSPACVTGKPAHSVSSYSQHAHTNDSYFNPTPKTSMAQYAGVPVSTPPLSPSGGSTSSTSSSLTSMRSLDLDHVPDFLASLFPRGVMRAAPYSKAVSVPAGGRMFDGFVLDLPKSVLANAPRAAIGRTLYVDGKGLENMQLRESIVAMLDLAGEQLSCQAFIVALDKSLPALGMLLHSLMYVGGTVVTRAPFEIDPSYVLVGIEV